MFRHDFLRRFLNYIVNHRLARFGILMLILCTTTLSLSSALATTAGDRDGMFGNAGVVKIPDFYLTALTIQPDGKLVLAGRDHNYQAVLTRYNLDGNPDVSFGNEGILILPAYDAARDLVVQADGKIIVLGQMYLMRLDANGAIDASFASMGVIPPFACTCSAAQVKIDTQGRIVVAGTFAGSGSNTDFIVTRYNSDGSLDMSFNSGSPIVTDFYGYSDYPTALVIQPDGKIVVAGTTYPGASWLFGYSIVRYTVNGNLDASFGSNGRVTPDITDNASANGVLIRPGGKLLVVGLLHSVLGLTQYDSNGQLDSSFGQAGMITHDTLREGIAVQQVDGRIVVFDFSHSLARFTSDGQLDLTFGNAGQMRDSDAFPSVIATDPHMALEPDGKVIVSDIANYYPAESIVVRYLANPLQPVLKVNALSPDPGQVITYTYSLTNVFPITLTQLTVSTQIPVGLTWAGPLVLDPPISATLGQLPIVLSHVTLPPSSAFTLMMPMTVNLGLAQGTIITNSLVMTSLASTPVTASAVITTPAPPKTLTTLVLTGRNLPVNILVLGQVWDPNNDAVFLVDVGVPLSGTTNLDAMAVIYTPTLDFTGTDTFTYTVSDGRFNANGDVTVRVVDPFYRLYIPVNLVKKF